MSETGTAITSAVDSEHFSPYRSDGKLYGFVCVVTGAQQPVGQAIIKELAGMFFFSFFSFCLFFYVVRSWGVVGCGL